MQQPTITKAGVMRLSYDLATLFADAGYLPDSIEPETFEKALPDFLRALGVDLPFEAPHCAGCGHFSPHTASRGCGAEVRDGDKTTRCGCLARDDDAAEQPFAQHNHDGGKLVWGRKKPLGQCRRCDQLRAGADAREAHPALQAVAHKREQEAATRRAMEEHFAPSGPHATGACRPVCTAFDY